MKLVKCIPNEPIPSTIISFSHNLYFRCIYFFELDFMCSFIIYLFGCAEAQLVACGIQLSLTRDGTWAPCIGSLESQPLEHQGSPFMSSSRMLYTPKVEYPESNTFIQKNIFLPSLSFSVAKLIQEKLENVFLFWEKIPIPAVILSHLNILVILFPS